MQWLIWCWIIWRLIINGQLNSYHDNVGNNLTEKSKNIETQKFIENIEILDYEKYQILQQLRKIVVDNYPNVKERMMYGGIMFSQQKDFGGVFVYKNHISFEFSDGYRFDDATKLLEGSGKYRRHLKLNSIADIEIKKVAFFVMQANESEN